MTWTIVRFWLSRDVHEYLTNPSGQTGGNPYVPRVPGYLKITSLQRCTSIIINFRLSSHKPKKKKKKKKKKYERGGYSRPKVPRDKRICKFCNKVEGELHFISFCITYDTLRDRLLKEFEIDKLRLCKDNEFNTLKAILNPRKRTQVTELSKYMLKALEIRDL